jgi:XTP/dITP diphosphohydrolase
VISSNPMNSFHSVLLVASTNKKKLAELQTLTADLGLKLLSLADLPAFDEVPETGRTFRENAELKALGYAMQTGYLTLAEDSGLSCDALGGEPGVYSARFAGPGKDDTDNNRKVLRLMDNIPNEQRGAHFTSVVAVALPGRLVGVAEGRVPGRISRELAGENGFGYDSIFYYPAFGKTFGQVSPEMKHRVSHRAQALSEAKKILKSFLTDTGREDSPAQTGF